MSRRNKFFAAAITTTVITSAFVSSTPNVEASIDTTIRFKDVKEHDYFYDAIHSLNARGIINGFEDGTFRPRVEVTRGQAAKMLALALQLDTLHVTNTSFTDLSPSNLYHGPVTALVSAGIMDGYEDRTFKPNELITRAQVSKIISVAFQFNTENLVDHPFTDVSSSNWYAPYVQTLLTYGITTGTSETTFSPNAPVTRGQLAEFIYRSENAVASMNKQIEVAPFAGNGRVGQTNGSRLIASFRSPEHLIALQDGAILVADRQNHLIRKIHNEQVTTFAGISLKDDDNMPYGGLYDGDQSTAIFNSPASMTVDTKGIIYIADAMNHAIRKVATTGQVSTIAGNGLVGTQDGKGEHARFHTPQAIAVAKDGTLYVADSLNHLIRKISVSGEVTTLNSPSLRTVEISDGNVEFAGDFKDGNIGEALFNEPSALVIDAKGNLYVSDTGNHVIRYIDFSANQVTTVAGSLTDGVESNELYQKGGFTNGAALEAAFNFPRGLALTKEGGLLIADSLNHSIRYLKDGHVTTLLENHNDSETSLNYPTSIAVLPDNSIVVADRDSNQIQQIKNVFREVEND